jgi:hypothetical protein
MCIIQARQIEVLPEGQLHLLAIELHRLTG